MLDEIILQLQDLAIEYDNLPEQVQKQVRNDAYRKHGTFAIALLKPHGDSQMDPNESVLSEYCQMQQGVSTVVPKHVVSTGEWQSTWHYSADAERAVRVGLKLGFQPIHRDYEEGDREAWTEEQARNGRVLANSTTLEAGVEVLVDGWPHTPDAQTTVAELKATTSINAVVRRVK